MYVETEKAKRPIVILRKENLSNISFAPIAYKITAKIKFEAHKKVK